MIPRMSASPSPHRFCVAPMMGCTDRHARYLMRLISRRARLYTEMIPAGALLHGDAERALRFDAAEHPVAVQLGGSDPADLARCARLAEGAGYDEVNLNVAARARAYGRDASEPPSWGGPPSSPSASRHAGRGVDAGHGQDPDRDRRPRRLLAVPRLRGGGGRGGLLGVHRPRTQGMAERAQPAPEPRDPPLRHDRVYRLKRDMPDLEVVLNGGIETLGEATSALREVDGVMLGRAAWHDLWLLAGVDRELFGDIGPPPERSEVVGRYLAYAGRQKDTRLGELVRPLLGLCRGVPGARRWRRTLGELAHRRDATVATVARACTPPPLSDRGAMLAPASLVVRKQ